MEQYSTPLTLEQQTHNKNAVTAMVLGIAGLVITWFPVVGLVLSIVGLVISTSNRKFAKEHDLKENSMNEAGYVCSLIGMIAGIITIVVAVFVICALVGVAGGIFQYVILPEIM